LAGALRAKLLWPETKLFQLRTKLLLPYLCLGSIYFCPRTNVFALGHPETYLFVLGHICLPQNIFIYPRTYNVSYLFVLGHICLFWDISVYSETYLFALNHPTCDINVTRCLGSFFKGLPIIIVTNSTDIIKLFSHIVVKF
jgi:hypothetical protein